MTCYNKCYNSLRVANQLSKRRRFASLCACSSANLTCRSHVGCRKWCPSNSTCGKCAPDVECQFCQYNVKRCAGKCQLRRKCHPLC